MKRFIIALTLTLLPILSIFADKVEKSGETDFVSYGFKVGFDATSLYMDEITIDNHTIERYNRDSQVGINLTLFTRFNFSKFYVQTGAIGNFSRSAISFDRNSWDPELTEENPAAFSMEGYCVDIPLQIGYYIVRDGEYSMALFCGPRIRFPIKQTYKTSFVNFGHTDIVEQTANFITTLSAGLNCSIGRTFFDIEYDWGVTNISDNITFTALENVSEPVIKLDRRHGTFSFSVGIFF